jgi:predicted N-acyltransferase
MTVELEIFTSIDDVPGACWDRSIAASEAPVFYSRDYLSAYEKSRFHGAKSHYYVLASTTGPEPDHAVLPLVCPVESDPLDTIRGSFPEIDLSAPCLIAPGWHCYDGLIPATSPDPKLFRALLEGVRQIARERSIAWLALANIDEESNQRPALESLGMKGRPADERYVLDLTPFQSFDAYVEVLSRRIRQDVRRYRRRASEIGLESHWRKPAEADLDSVLRVVHLTAERYGVQGYYRDGPFQQFVRLLQESGLVVELRLGEDLIGAGVCMLDSKRFHQWTFGVDYSAGERFSPYGIVFEQTFRAALASGAEILEGGRRNGLYKRRRNLLRHRLLTYVIPFP